MEPEGFSGRRGDFQLRSHSVDDGNRLGPDDWRPLDADTKLGRVHDNARRNKFFARFLRIEDGPVVFLVREPKVIQIFRNSRIVTFQIRGRAPTHQARFQPWVGRIDSPGTRYTVKLK